MTPAKITATPGLAAGISSNRGQVLLRDLLAALDAMQNKKLIAGDYVLPDGKCCALGALGLARGIDPEDMISLEDSDHRAAKLFGASISLIMEIERVNDQDLELDLRYRTNDEVQERRWARTREWVASKITAEA